MLMENEPEITRWENTRPEFASRSNKWFTNVIGRNESFETKEIYLSKRHYHIIFGIVWIQTDIFWSLSRNTLMTVFSIVQ